MSDVNELVSPPRKGKKPLPVEKRRVILSVRVLPSTMEYLGSVAGGESKGKVLDTIVAAYQSV